ncbi:O-antigen ligase family protein [Arenibacter lacus]|uniref:O-antigen ligase family protein n=1 Tax=Arenibacter lacus TaxID=2608629 RepID=UPI00123E1980|nr:O-antigen ligase family protein [Arenibacter lacus]
MKKLVFFMSFFLYSGYYAGLAIIFALNLSHLSRYYSIPIRAILILVMLYILLKNWRNLLNHKLSIYIGFFVVFWGLYTIKVLYTQNLSIGQSLSKDWFEFIFFGLTYVIIPFFTFLSLDLKTYKNTILNGMIFSGFLMGIVSTYIYGDLLISGVGRISLITYETGESVLSPLALSYAGALTIVLCLSKLIFSKDIKRNEFVYLTITIVFSFVMFLLGSSRGSVIALLLTIPLFLYYSPLKQKVKFMGLSTLSIPIIYWAIEASGSTIFERISNTKEDQGSGRDYLWRKALAHFIENPIFGGKVEIGGIYPHNLIIEILMSTGIVGCFLILSVITKGFSLGFLQSKMDNSNLFIILIMIQGFVQHFFTAGFYTSTLLFVPIALTFNIKNKNVYK